MTSTGTSCQTLIAYKLVSLRYINLDSMWKLIQNYSFEFTIKLINSHDKALKAQILKQSLIRSACRNLNPAISQPLQES